MEESRSAFKILTGKPTEERPLGRTSRRWGDNIRIKGGIGLILLRTGIIGEPCGIAGVCMNQVCMH